MRTHWLLRAMRTIKEDRLDPQFEHFDQSGTFCLWSMFFRTGDFSTDKELSIGLRKRLLVDKLSKYKLFQDNCFPVF